MRDTKPKDIDIKKKEKITIFCHLRDIPVNDLTNLYIYIYVKEKILQS